MQSIYFRIETKYGVYADTLHFTDKEFAALDEQQIEDMKQQRVNNWVSFIENPPVVEEQPAQE